MKSIHTLIEDINEVIKQKGGWDKTVTEYFNALAGSTMERRFTKTDEEYTKTLRMSNIGTPCHRKLWYHLNSDTPATELSPSTLLKFAYGDIVEALLLSLAKAAGHKVEGEQDECYAYGIKGHRDAVIDGYTVDVKSASTIGFNKFKYNSLRADDPFGYIQQLTGYVHAGKDDPLVTNKSHGAFLVMDKQHGHICLDIYDLSPELALLERKVKEVKAFSALPIEPERGFKPVPEGKSGNMKLPAGCSYCDHKSECWPKARKFMYSTGPVWLTTVVKTPQVPEIK